MATCRYCGNAIRFWNIDLFIGACPTCKRTGRGGILNTDLSRPNPTAADIHFPLFAIPVRVSVWFWIVHVPIGLVIAWNTSPVYFFIWTGSVAVSTVIHELGHVMAGLAFGARGYIVLTGLGGLAVGSSALYQRWKRILVYLAGPLTQLAFAGLLWSVSRFIPPAGADGSDTTIRMDRLLTLLIWINVIWSLANLLPFPPLDGGRIIRELFQGLTSSELPPWERDPDGWKGGSRDSA